MNKKPKQKKYIRNVFSYTSNYKGITLIALIATIVLMLILATITIDLIFDGKLFSFAGKAKKDAGSSEEIETIQIAYIRAKGSSKDTIVEESELKMYTDEYDSIDSVTPIGTSFVIKFKSNNEYILNKSGNISKKEALLAYEIPAQKYGDYVFNYSDIDVKDGGASQLSDWRVFYTGKVANEAEDHIYLIASNLLDYDSIPQTKKGHALNLGNNQYHANTGNVLSDYANGSNDVAEETRYLNSGYFEFLTTNNVSSTNNNMKTTAYICDTSVWNTFKTDKADFVIGSPTVELLLKSYNKKYGTNYIAGSINYSGSVNSVGYFISTDGGTTWIAAAGTNTLTNDTLYRLSLERYWLASPRASAAYNLRVDGNGQVDNDAHGGVYNGFRPVVRLKADTMLEEVEGGYRIVE